MRTDLTNIFFGVEFEVLTAVVMKNAVLGHNAV
jgi:hypothetical protein